MPRKAARATALTPKQQRFVDEYLLDLNATQAAIRAGYRATTARFIGHENLTKPYIADAIAARQAALQASTQVTQERVINELALVGFADMATYVTWGPAGVTINESALLRPEHTRVVGSVSQTTTLAGGSLRFKLHDKIAALTKLGEHLGIFKPTSHDLPDIHVHVNTARERLTARVAHLAQRHAEDAMNGA
jgi:phage terminase small subunit